MESILDADISRPASEPQEREIAKRRHRIFASIIDSLLMMVPAMIVVFTLLSVDTRLAQIIGSLFYPLYKVYMEYTYGATAGKQWLGLQVVTVDFGKPDLGNILKRNGIVITYVALTIAANGVFMLLDGAEEPVLSLSTQELAGNVIDWMYYLVSFVDAIIMINDENRRSVHDFLGGTVVVTK